MGTLAQTVLPFKVEATEEKLMANAGLTLFGEFVQGLGFSRWLAQEMPKPASGRDYPAAANVTPLVLTLTGGGRSLEDLPMLKGDKALLGLPNQQTLPPHRRDGRLAAPHRGRAGLAGLSRLDQRIVAARLSQTGITEHTLDAEDSQIIAEKEPASANKGEQGYMAISAGCGQFAANAVFFRIGMIAHNPFVLFKHSVPAGNWSRQRVATVRGRLFHLPGKVVRHAGLLVLKIAAELVELFRDIRSKSLHLAQAFSP